MEADGTRARASFMCRASDLRENLYFAHPEQKMQAIKLYCSDAYGSMLWQLSSKYAESFFKAWNIQARLSWNIPRETHSYLVEGFFCKGYPSLRNQVLARYHNFIKKLRESPSKEVRFLVNLVKYDMRSITGRNVSYISDLCKSNILVFANWKVKQMLPKNACVESWRSGLLTTLLAARWSDTQHQMNIDKKQCEEMIRSLCIS